MLAIYKKELQSYFRSFIGFLFVGATLFFLGLYFVVYNLLYGYPYFSYTLTGTVSILLFSVPILTMRILAEEKRSRSDQLILTAPVTVGSVVLGKFLALLTIFTIPVAVSCVYPLIMRRYGAVPMGESYLAVLAYFLFGMLAIAVGIFISSLTESQIIAAVLSFAVLFVGYMMSSICDMISSTGNLLTAIIGVFDIYTPFSNLLNGTLNIGSVVYFVSMTALILFLTVQSIQKRRYSVSVKNFSIGAYSVGMIVVAVAAAMMVNVVIAQMPSTWTNIDLTTNQLYSLTDQTKEYVRSIEEDVNIYVLASEDNQDAILKQTLDRYDDLSSHITVTYVDPNISPTFYMQYTNAAVSINSVIVESAKRSMVIDYNDIYEVSSQLDPYTYTYINETTGYDGEGQITSALAYVLSESTQKLYLLSGHDEYALSSNFLAALDKANVEYETIDLMDYDVVPDDAACLFVHAPSRDFSAEDLSKLEAYLNGGGSMIYVAGYAEGAMPNTNALLDGMGLSILKGLVIEPDTSNYSGTPYYLLPNQSRSVYTEGLYSNNYYVFAPLCQGIVIADENMEGMRYTTFLSTSDSAFSKNATGVIESYDKEDGDIDGPFGIGVEAVKTVGEGVSATMVVYGSTAIFTDTADQYVRGDNMILFSNTISALVNYEMNTSVPVKSYEASYLSLSQKNVVAISLVTVIALPLGCVIAGFVIWFRRRSR
ncbi:MAG: Gldg family protein [Candidatus Gastranaerophilales bacterium]|nr:Gldg family protein [Candidatus Gastranaerophilales bacterium]